MQAIVPIEMIVAIERGNLYCTVYLTFNISPLIVIYDYTTAYTNQRFSMRPDIHFLC